MTEKNCIACGLIFKAATKNKYCCRACYDSDRAKIVKNRIVKCLQCDSLFNKLNAQPYKFCSSVCYYLHRKANPIECINCKCLFSAIAYNKKTKRLISVNSRKTCSNDCHINWIKSNRARKDKISLAFSGSKHPNWQGGSHSLSSRGAGWVKLRAEIKLRDGYICRHCGMSEEQSIQAYKCGLHVNHIKPFNQYGGNNLIANKPSNLESLCPSCHTIADANWRKNNSVQYTLTGMFIR